MKVNHKNPEFEIESGPCDLEFGRYPNGQLAMQLVAEDGEPWATATVAVGAFVPEGHVAIKDYSENVGMVESLQEAGIVGKEIVARIASGFVSIPVLKLLVDPEDFS